MITNLIVQPTGNSLTVQDFGRPNRLADGLSRGGAADRLALQEAAALLGLSASASASLSTIELPLVGGRFSVTAPTRIALTGAPMKTTLNTAPVPWNSTHLLVPGDQLTIGAAYEGTYGYLTPAGGLATARIMGAQATHLTAGIGASLTKRTELTLNPDANPNAVQMILRPEKRFSGGEVRVMPGPQSDLFDAATSDRFFASFFTQSATGNRQGKKLDFGGAPFRSNTSSFASDIIQSGDIQMTGDGVPYVLLTECQTMGGYPRIGTVIPQDIPRIAQATPGTPIRFKPISLAQADALWKSFDHTLSDLKKQLQPLRRDPHDINDLLSYQLIGGVIRGDET